MHDGFSGDDCGEDVGENTGGKFPPTANQFIPQQLATHTVSSAGPDFSVIGPAEDISWSSDNSNTHTKSSTGLANKDNNKNKEQWQ